MQRIGLMLGWVTVLAVLATAQTCPTYAPAAQVGLMAVGPVTEASGLAVSRHNAGVLWTHNDSGGGARVYALNTTGRLLGTYTLAGATAIDYEDMTLGPGPTPGVDYLYVGDIGDNNAVRASVTVYRVVEPMVDPDQAAVTATLAGTEAMTLVYPDGARDAETLMVDPQTGDLYVVSKRETRSRLYRAAYPQAVGVPIVLTYEGQLPWGGATGGDIGPRGRLLAVRGYFNVSLWRRPAGTTVAQAIAATPCEVALAWEPQGEALGIDAAGCGFYTLSEYHASFHPGGVPLYHYGQAPPCPWAGDYDLDDCVDGADLGWLLQGWLAGGSGAQALDLTGDRAVDLRDVAALGADWLAGCGP